MKSKLIILISVLFLSLLLIFVLIITDSENNNLKISVIDLKNIKVDDFSEQENLITNEVIESDDLIDVEETKLSKTIVLSPIAYVDNIEWLVLIETNNSIIKATGWELLYKWDKIKSMSNWNVDIIFEDDSIVRLGNTTYFIINNSSENNIETTLKKWSVWWRILKPLWSDDSLIMNNEDVSLAVRGTSFLFEYDGINTELVVIDSYSDDEDKKWIVVTDKQTKQEYIIKAEEKIVKEESKEIKQEKIKLVDLIAQKPVIKENNQKDIIYMVWLIEEMQDELDENLLNKIRWEISETIPKDKEINVFFDNDDIVELVQKQKNVQEYIEQNISNLIIKDEIINEIKDEETKSKNWDSWNSSNSLATQEEKQKVIEKVLQNEVIQNDKIDNIVSDLSKNIEEEWFEIKEIYQKTTKKPNLDVEVEIIEDEIEKISEEEVNIETKQLIKKEILKNHEEEVADEAKQKAKVEEEARLKAEAEEKARAEEEARLKAEAEEKARAEEEARLKSEAEEKAKAEKEAKLKSEAEEKAKAEKEAKLKSEAEEKVKAEKEAKLHVEEEKTLLEEENQVLIPWVNTISDVEDKVTIDEDKVIDNNIIEEKEESIKFDYNIQTIDSDRTIIEPQESTEEPIKTDDNIQTIDSDRTIIEPQESTDETIKTDDNIQTIEVDRTIIEPQESTDETIKTDDNIQTIEVDRTIIEPQESTDEPIKTDDNIQTIEVDRTIIEPQESTDEPIKTDDNIQTIEVDRTIIESQESTDETINSNDIDSSIKINNSSTTWTNLYK